MTTADTTELVLLGDPAGYDDALRRSAADVVGSLQSRVPELTLPRRITWRTFPGPDDRDWLEISMSDDPQTPRAAVSRRFRRSMMTRPDTRDVYHLQVFGDLLHKRTEAVDREFQRLLAEWHEEVARGDGR